MAVQAGWDLVSFWQFAFRVSKALQEQTLPMLTWAHCRRWQFQSAVTSSSLPSKNLWTYLSSSLQSFGRWVKSLLGHFRWLAQDSIMWSVMHICMAICAAATWWIRKHWSAADLASKVLTIMTCCRLILLACFSIAWQLLVVKGMCSLGYDDTLLCYYCSSVRLRLSPCVLFLFVLFKILPAVSNANPDSLYL